MTLYSIGIDIGGTSIKSGIVDQSGRIVQSDSVPTPALAGRDAILARILDRIAHYQNYALSEGIDLQSLGIGTAGFVHYKDGRIASATDNLPGWGGTPLRAILSRETNLPVHVDNDINAIAMGERWVGAARGLSDFVCIAIGTGIGGCLVIDGTPYRGRDGYAGIYGHQIIEHQGKACSCGKRGCWEQYASVSALRREAAAVFGAQSDLALSPERLFEEARAGYGPALRIVDRFAEYVAIGLTNAIHAFNPQTIVVGGAIAAQGDFLLERIRHHVLEKTLRVYWDKDPIAIVPAILGDNSGVIGAARQAMEACFQMNEVI